MDHMSIDFSIAGSTTHLSCGTTTAGHYIYAQQGISSFVPNTEVREIFDILAKYAPMPPGEKWELTTIDLRDYKDKRNKNYRIAAEYIFRKGRKKYTDEVELDPENVKVVYKLFLEAVKNYK